MDHGDIDMLLSGSPYKSVFEAYVITSRIINVRLILFFVKAN